MEAKNLSIQHLGQINSKKILVNLHYWICVIALWSIIPTYYHYKVWYIVTAIAVVATAMAALLGVIRIDGLSKAIIPVLCYFLYLLSTSLWAADNFIGVYQVMVDSILIIHFALFFIVSINNPLRRIANVYILAAYPAAAALYYYMGDKGGVTGFLETRVGWTAMALLPYAVPFCIWKIKMTESRRGLLSLLLTFWLILMTRTRAPIIIAAALFPLAAVYLSKNLRSGLALLVKIGLILVLCVAGSLVFEKPRTFMAESLGRLQGRSVEISGVTLSEDWLRAFSYQEGLRMLFKAQPFGIGYMNFESWFIDTYGIDTSMHSAMIAWGLEGGLICVLLVLYLLYRYYSILRGQIKKAKDEYETGFYQAMEIAMVGVLINAVVNQAHQAPTFFVLLGIAYSLPYRNKLSLSSSDNETST